MCRNDSFALVSIALFASVVAFGATNYISWDAFAPRDTVAHRSDDTTMEWTRPDSAARQSPTRDVEGDPRDAQPPSLRSTSDDVTREKTLALLILMLRDGRGAR